MTTCPRCVRGRLFYDRMDREHVCLACGARPSLERPHEQLALLSDAVCWCACGRGFATAAALGGHRSSHTRAAMKVRVA